VTNEWTDGLSEQDVERVRNLHFGSVVIDCLGGSVMRRPPPSIDGRDIIDQRRDAGVTVSNETLAADNQNFRTAIDLIYDYLSLGEVASDRAILIERVADIQRAHDEGKHGLILGFQGSSPFEDEPGLAFIFAKLGVRIAGLAYNQRYRAGEGCLEPEQFGLTAFGKRLVLSLNEAGITVDLSHVGQRTSLDAAVASYKPVIFSHSNVAALTPHPRNLSDDQIRAAAGTGGVIGIGPHSVLCEEEKGVRPTMDHFLNHIEYVAELVGIDHVGIGTDMFGGQTLGEQVYRKKFSRVVPGFFASYDISEKFVSGLDDVRLFPRITHGLLGRGFSDDDIRQVLSGNFLRVFKETWPA
jgi:membrane dipeptidase